jgi:type I restriction enzyme M protein
MVNLPECNVSQDTIAIKLSRQGKREFRSGFIAAYLNAREGLALMGRRFQGNVQQHLSLEDGKSIRVPALSIEFQTAVHRLVLEADRQQDAVISAMANAEAQLLAALGLANWTPPQPLTYSARASYVLAAGRIDAQYFRPLFGEVELRLQATGRAVELGTLLTTNARGRQPIYANEGLPVINSKHVRINRVIFDDNRTAIEAGSPVVIETGDVLVNGTGVGTIGRAAPYLHNHRCLPDNHVTVLRTRRVDPVYLASFLNSPLGQWQIERHIKGSSGQIELYPNEIARIVIWDAPEAVQASVRDSIMSAFREERRANYVLGAAKRAVEIAIERGEPAALAYLDQVDGGN